MSAERDELAKIMDEWLDDEAPLNLRRYIPVADSILAAGYQKPRTVTTFDDLRMLRVDAVVFSDCTAYQNYGDDAWAAAGRFYDVSQITLPATVLHEPS